MVEVQRGLCPLLAPLSHATFCDTNAAIDFLGASAHWRPNRDAVRRLHRPTVRFEAGGPIDEVVILDLNHAACPTEPNPSPLPPACRHPSASPTPALLGTPRAGRRHSRRVMVSWPGWPFIDSQIWLAVSEWMVSLTGHHIVEWLLLCWCCSPLWNQRQPKLEPKNKLLSLDMPHLTELHTKYSGITDVGQCLARPKVR